MGGARAPGQSRARLRRLSTLRARGLRGRRPVEPGVKTLYVVDGHSQLFRAYHAVGYLSTSKGIPTQAVLILDRKSTRLNSSHGYISYAVFCLKKKKKTRNRSTRGTASEQLAQ